MKTLEQLINKTCSISNLDPLTLQKHLPYLEKQQQAFPINTIKDFLLQNVSKPEKPAEKLETWSALSTELVNKMLVVLNESHIWIFDVQPWLNVPLPAPAGCFLGTLPDEPMGISLDQVL